MDFDAIDNRLSESGRKIKIDFFMAARRNAVFVVAAGG
jgi:hypothetical protein